MRYYTIQTKTGTLRLPSVTTILDVTMPISDRHVLEMARVRSPSTFAIRQSQGRDRGNYIHRYCVAQLRGEVMGHGLYGRWLRHIDPFLKSLRKCNPGLFWTEELVYDEHHGYAGTFDYLVRLPGEGDRLCLVDLKTTNFKAWPRAIASAELQAAAYAVAWNQQHKLIQAEAIASVHLSPYGYQVFVTDDFRELVNEFYDRRREFGARIAALAVEDA